MSYVIIRARWCNITVLSIYAPTEDKPDDMKGSFYDELKCAFDKIL
jgi:hypothetical protein